LSMLKYLGCLADIVYQNECCKTNAEWPMPAVGVNRHMPEANECMDWCVLVWRHRAHFYSPLRVEPHSVSSNFSQWVVQWPWSLYLHVIHPLQHDEV